MNIDPEQNPPEVELADLFPEETTVPKFFQVERFATALKVPVQRLKDAIASGRLRPDGFMVYCRGKFEPVFSSDSLDRIARAVKRVKA